MKRPTRELYPPCPLTDAYPVLRRIPVEERAPLVKQAEAGIPLNAEQCARLDFHESITCVWLIPATGKATEAQLNALFRPELRFHWADAVEAMRQQAKEKEGAA
jgi:hypothetical protein